MYIYSLILAIHGYRLVFLFLITLLHYIQETQHLFNIQKL